MNIANVAFDKEIEHIEEIRNSVDEMVDYLSICAFESDQFTLMQFVEDEKTFEFKIKVAYDEKINVTISSVGIMQALFRFSINPKLKIEIFENSKFKESLKRIIMMEEDFVDVERFYAIELFSQLCFEDKISEILSQDKDLCNKISSFANRTDLTYNKLRRSSQQFDWILNELKIETLKID